MTYKDNKERLNLRIEYVDGGSIQELVKKRELHMLSLDEDEVLDIVV